MRRFQAGSWRPPSCTREVPSSGAWTAGGGRGVGVAETEDEGGRVALLIAVVYIVRTFSLHTGLSETSCLRERKCNSQAYLPFFSDTGYN
jgi:hypothetical protein